MREREGKSETGAGRGGGGPLWLLIVLISPLDSPLIALLCLQGHHYSDQVQLCFTAFHEYHFAKQLL